MPVYYECQRCAACCKWPGQVRLREDEIDAIARFKTMSSRDFVQQFTRLAADRLGLALIEKMNGECIFLEGNHCQIQAVKPAQCRDFPNFWRFPGFEKHCEAIPREVSEKQFVELAGKSSV